LQRLAEREFLRIREIKKRNTEREREKREFLEGNSEGVAKYRPASQAKQKPGGGNGWLSVSRAPGESGRQTNWVIASSGKPWCGKGVLMTP